MTTDDIVTAPTMDADTAAALYELNDGEHHGEWLRLATQLIRTGRWMERYWLVVTNGGGCFGIRYELGLTEEQENELPWEESDEPLKLVQLVGVPVTSTRYLTEAEYEARTLKAVTE